MTNDDDDYDVLLWLSLQLTDLFTDSQKALEERSKNLASTQVALTVTRQDLLTTTREKEEEKFLVDEHVKTEQVLQLEAEQVRGKGICTRHCVMLL